VRRAARSRERAGAPIRGLASAHAGTPAPGRARTRIRAAVSRPAPPVPGDPARVRNRVPGDVVRSLARRPAFRFPLRPAVGQKPGSAPGPMRGSGHGPGLTTRPRRGAARAPTAWPFRDAGVPPRNPARYATARVHPSRTRPPPGSGVAVATAPVPARTRAATGTLTGARPSAAVAGGVAGPSRGLRTRPRWAATPCWAATCPPPATRCPGATACRGAPGCPRVRECRGETGPTVARARPGAARDHRGRSGSRMKPGPAGRAGGSRTRRLASIRPRRTTGPAAVPGPPGRALGPAGAEGGSCCWSS